MEALCKRERELKEWLERGSNNWYESFFIYEDRRVNPKRSMRAVKSWFNKTLKSLKSKGHMKDVGFVFESDGETGLRWVNPLVDGTKSSAVVGQEHTPVLLERRTII